METGERSVLEIKRAPDQAAACIARNIENARHYQVTARPLDGGLVELIVRSQVHNLAVVHVGPGRATFWMRSLFMGREDFVRAAVAGC